jgi:protein ImuB
MTVAHARALLKNPVLTDADPHGDRVALERLARWCMRFSPVVGVDTGSIEEGHEPDSLLIDIAGCERVFRGEDCLLGLISAALTGLRLHHRLGVAPTIGAAWAAAHFGDEVITRVAPSRVATSRSGAPKGRPPIAQGVSPGYAPAQSPSPEWTALNDHRSRGTRHCAAPVDPRVAPPGLDESAMSPTQGSRPGLLEPAPLGLRNGLTGGAELLFQSVLSDFLSPLPIAALRLPSKAQEALTELGLDRVEDLMRLPRVSIPSRFGPEVLRRLDQALGHIHEEVTPIRLDPPLRLERLLEGPTTNHEAIELVTRELLGLLQDELSRREAGVVSLALQLDRLKRDCRGTETIEERLRLSRPTRSPRHLWSLLRPRVERVNLGYGVEGISLVVVRQRRLKHRQLSREDFVRRGGVALQRHGEPCENQSSSELLDTLVNRLGEDRVVRIRQRDSHTPERAAAYEPVITEQGRERRGDVATIPAGPRPSVLFENSHPAHAIAMMPDRPPSTVRWQGQDLRIVTGIGPERIGEEWWKDHVDGTPGLRPPKARIRPPEAHHHDHGPQNESASASTLFRDYFRVQDHTGRWLWVFRFESRWFVHGFWA